LDNKVFDITNAWSNHEVTRYTVYSAIQLHSICTLSYPRISNRVSNPDKTEKKHQKFL